MSPLKKIIAQSGEPLLPARAVAKRLDIASDYVGKLCREGKLSGQQIDNAWFVSEASIAAFEKSRSEAKAARAQELAQERHKENYLYRKANGLPLQITGTRNIAGKAAALAFGGAFLFAAIVFAGGVVGPQGLLGSQQNNTAAALAVAAPAGINSPFFGFTPTSLEASQGNGFGDFFSNIFAYVFSPHASTQPSIASQPPTSSASGSAGVPTQQPAVATSSAQNTKTTIVQNITNPVVERDVVQTVSGVTQASLTSQLQSLQDTLRQEIYSSINSAPGPVYSTGGVTNNVALSQIIDQLSGVAITGGTITNASISGGSISGLNGLDLASGCFSVAGVCLTSGGNAAGDTGAVQFNTGGAFDASTTGLFFDSADGRLGIGTSTPQSTLSLGAGGVIRVTSNDGSSNGCFAEIGGQLQYSNDCNTFQSFSASAAGGWTDTGTVVHLTTDTEQVAVGTSTPYAKFTVWGDDTSASTLALQVVNSASTTLLSVSDSGLLTTQNILANGSSTLQNVTAINATTTNATSTSLFVQSFGLGAGNYFTSLLGTGLINSNGSLAVSTSSLGLLASSSLSSANGLLAYNPATGVLTASTSPTFTNATSTDFFATTASSTNLFASVAQLGTATINALTLDSPLAISSGGTGTSTAPTYGQLLLGNDAGGYDLVATSSLGITSGSALTFTYPLVNSANIVSLAFGTTTANNWSGLQQFNGGASTTALTVSGVASTTNLTVSSVLSSLLKTDATGNVVAAIAGTDYLTPSSGITSLSAGGVTTTGGAATLATSSALSFNGLTSGQTIVDSSGTFTFTPTLSGTLDNSGLTNSSLTVNGTNISLGSSGAITAASSTLLGDDDTFSGTDVFNNTITGSISGNAGTVTNGVYTTTFGGLFDNRLSATTSLPNITTLASLSLPYSQLTGTPNISGYPFAFAGNATTTLTQFNGGLTSFASSTIGNGAQAGGLTINGGATTTGNALISGTLTLGTALSVSNGGTGTSTAPSYGQLLVGNNAGGYDLLATSSLGIISGSSFGYPFPSNATSTLLQFNGGATTTALTVLGVASTTDLVVSSLATGGTTCVQADADGVLSSTGTACGSGGGSSVATVSNGDGSLTISPTSGAVVASLNVGHSNTFSALQTFANILATGSTTLQNFTGANATTTSATSTNLFATTASSTNLFTSNLSIASLNGILKATNGAVSAAVAGTDYQAPLTFSYPLVNAANVVSTAFGTTTTNAFSQLQTFTSGFLANASSTLQNFTALNATTSQATTTNLAITSITSSLLKTNVNGTIIAAVAGTDYVTPTGLASAFPFTVNTGYNSTTTPIGFLGASNGIFANASSTLSVFQSASSTIGKLFVTTGATTSALAVTGSTTISSQLNSTFANLLASTTLLGNTLLTNATTTSFAITNVANGSLLKVTTNGTVAAAVAGTDYSNFAYPFPSNATSTTLTFSNGLLSLASTTIGAGGQTTGLTISGGSTTTLNAYFASSVGIGTTSPYRTFSVVGTTTSTGGFNVDSNQTLLTYQGSTTLSLLGTRNFFAGLGVNGSTTKSTGADNVFIGNSAGYSVTTGTNVYIGSLSGIGSTTGAPNRASRNNAVGYATLQSDSVGNDNEAFGNEALQQNTVGASNIAIGTFSLINNTTGTNNVAVGSSGGTVNAALDANTTGNDNSAFGTGALSGNTTGFNNSAFGFLALDSNTTGANNTAVGNQSGTSITTGYSNLLLGDNTQTTGGITTGGGNVGVGSNIFFPSQTANSQLNIGNLLFGTLPATTTGFKLPTTGSIGVGTSSPFATFAIGANNGSTNTTLFAIGSSTASATTTLFSVSNTGLATLTNLLATGSSTLQNFTGVEATTSQATTTNLALTSLSNTLLFANSSGSVIGTSTLATNFGGTGSTTLSGILAGNGTGAVKSLVVGTGLTFDGTTLAASGSGITQIGPAGQLQSGSTQTLATTTSSFNGLTAGITIVATGNTQTFTPTLIGTLDNTGLTHSALTVSAGAGLTGGNTISLGGSTSLALDTTAANIWTGLQQFNGSASSSALSANIASFGSTATSSFAANGALTLAQALAVSSGGTGAASFGQGWIFSNGGTGALAASTSPTVNYIFATSTTATSSFAGGLAVGSNALNVLQNGNVGVDTSSPIKTFDVSGTGRFSSTLTLTGTPSCAGGQALQTNGSGDIACGTISFSGISNAGGWSTNNHGFVTLATTSDQVSVGAATSSPYAKLVISSDSAATTTLALVPASGQTANILDIYNSSGVLNSVLTAAGNLGLGTTSPFARLSVAGAGYFTGNVSALNITTTNVTATGTLSVGGSTLVTTANGNVGIGTSSPTAHLAVSGGNIFQVASGNPTLASSTPTASNSYQTYISGNYAYEADNAGGLRIFDISNPSNPVLAGTYSSGSDSVQDVVVAGKYAYIADTVKGVIILDVSNVASPRVVSTYSSVNLPQTLTLSGKYLYVADYNNHAVRILDVSNPTAPVLAGSFTTGGNPYVVIVSGQYAYIGDYNNSVYIVDISNPAAPVQVARYTTGVVFPSGLYLSGKNLYVADAGAGGMYILNVANPALPSAVGSYGVGQSFFDVAVAGTNAYLADAGDGSLVELDVTNPASPTLVGSYAAGGTFGRGITLAGKYAYLSDDDAGLQIVDINGATLPAANIGSLAVNTANISDTLNVGQDIYAGGGLDVGVSGIYSRGTIAAYVASSTQVNPAVATFIGGNVGIGTSSPFATLSVNGNGFFGGNLTATNITATGTLQALNIFATGSTTVAGIFNSTLQNLLASSTLSGNTLLTNATTSSFAISNIASGNLLKTTTGGALVAAVAGTDYVTGAGLTAAFPFTTSTFGSTAANATSTLIKFNAGIASLASSTIGNGTQAGGLTVNGGATTTGNSLIQGTLAVKGSGTSTIAGSLAIGTTTPPSNSLFTIATSTLMFMIDSIYGNVGIGTQSNNNTKLAVQGAGGNDGPQYVSTYTPTTTPSDRSSFVSGNYAYSLDGANRIDVIDVSNPGLPAHAAFIATSSGLGIPFVANNLLYAEGGDGSMDIYDVSTPTSPVFKSSIATSSNFNGSPDELFVSGSTLYATDNTQGINIYSLSTPTAPAYLSSVGGGSTTFFYPFVFGNYLYLYNSSLNRIDIYNVSIPSSPSYAGSYVPSNGISVASNNSPFHVSGNYLYYISANQADVGIVDISNPASPTLVGTYVSGTGSLTYLTVSGSYLYLSSGEVVDISSPSNPQLVDRYTSPSGFLFWDTVGSISGNHLYGEDAPGNLEIVDISQPAPPLAATFNGGRVGVGTSNPQAQLSVAGHGAGLMLQSTYTSTTTTITNSLPFVSGNYLYDTNGNGAIEIANVSNSANPVFAGEFSTSTGLFNPFVAGTTLYTFDGENALELVNVSTPASPSYIGSMSTTSGYTNEYLVSNNTLYIVDENANLDIFNVSNPASPALLSVLPAASFPSSPSTSSNDGIIGIDANNNLLYLLGSDGSIMQVDVSDPSSPASNGSYLATPSGSRRLSVNPLTGEVYATNFSSDYINAIGSDLVLDGTYVSPSGGATAYTFSGTYGGRYLFADNLSGGVDAIDITNPANMFLADTYESLSGSSEAFISGTNAYMANGSGGMDIVNLLPFLSPSSAATFTSGLVGIGTQNPLAELDVNGDFALEGVGRYLNFDAADSGIGAGGYGLRDNGGVLQYKNSGGIWSGFSIVDSNYNTFAGPRTFTNGGATGGDHNIAFNEQALSNNTTGSDNTALGNSALLTNTTGSGNTAIGNSALLSNTIGSNNDALGSEALGNNLSGSDNVALGESALQQNTSGTNNIALGEFALSLNSLSNQNIAFGDDALGSYNPSADDISNGFSDQNIAIGEGAGNNQTTGNGNIFIGSGTNVASTTGSNQLNIGNTIYGDLTNGYIGIGTTSPFAKFSIQTNNGDTENTLFAIGSSTASATTALFAVTNTGTLNFNLDASTSTLATFGGRSFLIATSTGGNTAVGLDSLSAITSGANNVAVGNQALGLDTSGNLNVAIGEYTLLANTTGFTNTAAGYNALSNNSTGFQNTAIGSQALLQNTTGVNNIALGNDAGHNNTSGYDNTYLGYKDNTGGAGNITTGFNDVFIGYNTLATSTSASNFLNIGNFIFGTLPATTSATTLALPTTGSIGIGTTSPFAKFSIQTNNGDTENTLFAIGSSTASATTTLFSVSNTGNVSAAGILSTNGTTGYFAIDNNRTLYASSTTHSVQVGFGAGNITNASASYNAIFGYNAGNNITSGANNVLLGGYSTGSNSNLSSGSNNVSIGYNISLPSATNNNQLDIQNILYGTGNSGAGSAVSTGNLGVASTSPFAKFSIQTNNGDTENTLFAIGSSTASATTTLFSVSNTGSTTLFELPSSLLKTNSNGTLIAAVAGTDYVTGAGLAAAFPFTPTTNFGATANSTSTPIWFTAGLQASSTSQLASVFAGGLGFNATTSTSTLITFGGRSFLIATSTGGNTAVGLDALSNITSGSNNTILGASTGRVLTTGSRNTGVGATTLGVGSAGSDNVAVGYNALSASVLTQNRNTAIGVGAILNGGTDNIALGYNALSTSFPGYDNIAIGQMAGQSIGFASNSILIGYDAEATSSSATISNFLNIGNLLFGTLPATTSASTLALPISGSIGIGTTSPFAKFSIQTNNGDTENTLFAIGSSTASATSTLFSISNTGSTTIANGINITAGCYAVNGTCLSTGTFSWTPTTNFGAAANSTSTPILFTAGLQASSTIVAPRVDFWPATSTLLSYKGQELLIASSTNQSIFLGLGAGTSTASGGTGNVGVGYQALQACGFNCSSSVAIGFQALLRTTNSNNTAVGNGSLDTDTSGADNVGLGNITLGSNTTGKHNTAVGSTALFFNTTGNDNVALGYQAGLNITTGFANIILGSAIGAGANITSGGGNIGIGDEVFFPSATANSQLNIGNLLFGSLPATTTAFKLPTSGSIGIGTTSPFAKFSIQTNNGDTENTLFAIGSSTASATTTLFSITNTGTATLAGAFLPGGTITNNLASYDLGATGSRWNALWAGTVNVGTSTFSLKSDIASNLGFYTAASGGGTEALTITSGGNVGVGTTTPGSLFSVGSTNGINFSTATSSFSTTGGINLASGCFAVGGTCISGGTPGTNGTNGGTLTKIVTETSGSGTYTPTTGTSYIVVRMVGGGGGGAGSGSAGGGGTGGTGGNTTFSSLTASGGVGGTDAGNGANGGTGGSASGGDVNISGGNGGGTAGNTPAFGGSGGTTVFGGAAVNDVNAVVGGGAATPNTGAGGSGASMTSGGFAGGGGGAGGYIEKLLSPSSSSYSYAVGAAGTAGTTGSGGAAGGSGGSGIIIIYEYTGGVTAGVVTSGTQGQTAFYNADGSTLSGTSTLFITQSGSVGVGTTSPYAKLSIQANNGDTLTTLFAIGSSTQTATTTLFSVGNNGQVQIGTTTDTAFFSVQGTTSLSQIVNITTPTGATAFHISSAGNVGIGSSSPWATASIITNNAANGGSVGPAMVLATTSTWTAGQAPLLIAEATTTGALDYARVAIGTTSPWGGAGLRDQLTVAGRIYSTWQYLNCDVAGSGQSANITAAATVTQNYCGPFIQYNNLADGGAIISNGSPGFISFQPGEVTSQLVNNGDTLRTANLITSATTSPVVEAWVQAVTNSAATSTPEYLVGLTNTAFNAVTLPTDGIYFIASTTANWIAVARKGSVETEVNTGIATSSTGFQKLRIEATGSTVTYLINGNVVANISTNITTQTLAPIVSAVIRVATTGGTPADHPTLNIALMRFWMDEPPGGDVVGGIPVANSSSYDPIQGADIAEADLVDDSSSYIPGMLVSNATSTLAGSTTPMIRPSQGRYDNDLIGAVSTSPSSVLGQETVSTVRVALTGRVPVIVSLENGPIYQGDRITASSIAGVGMKATRPGEVIGTALESFDPNATTTPQGTCDTDLEAQLQGAGVNLGTTTCVASILVSLKPGSYTSNIFGDAGATFTDISDALNELSDAALTQGAQLAKLVVGELVAKVAVVGDLFADHITVNNLTVGSAAMPAGITLYDQQTKAPYCISMQNGVLVTASGECGNTAGTPTPAGASAGPDSSSASTTSSSDSGSESASSTPTVPPTVTINDDNPATISVGSTYADLGATVSDVGVGQAGDTNLGYQLFVDGAPVQNISLDTSTTTTYSIDYVATDHTGLTATSTRTVNVQ